MSIYFLSPIREYYTTEKVHYVIEENIYNFFKKIQIPNLKKHTIRNYNIESIRTMYYFNLKKCNHRTSII